jgi:hypothetical protein
MISLVMPSKTTLFNFAQQLRLFVLSILLSLTSSALAEEYLSNEGFIALVFSENQPHSKLHWLTEEDKKIAQSILGHPIKRARLRYWQNQQQFLWILDEIGKVKPITIGVAVNQNKIAQLNILAFRESRGWEVKNRTFTEQFLEQTLTKNHELTKSVDGIAGATLSVRAVTRVARLALYLSSQASQTAPVTQTENNPSPNSKN